MGMKKRKPNIRKTLKRLAEKQGWDQATQLELLLDLIEDLGIEEKAEIGLETVASEEDAANCIDDSDW